jgi:hypothetical protein
LGDGVQVLARGGPPGGRRHKGRILRRGGGPHGGPPGGAPPGGGPRPPPGRPGAPQRRPRGRPRGPPRPPPGAPLGRRGGPRGRPGAPPRGGVPPGGPRGGPPPYVQNFPPAAAPQGGPPGGAPRGAIFGGSGLAGGKTTLRPVKPGSIGGAGGPPQKRTGCAPCRGAQKGPNFRPLWVFLPLFCGRSHHVSPSWFFQCFSFDIRSIIPSSPLGGAPPIGGRGLGAGPGGPPGGVPRGRPVIGPLFLYTIDT